MPSSTENFPSLPKSVMASSKKKTIINKKLANTGIDVDVIEDIPPIIRGPSSIANARNILTGYYGARGERLRHTVHDRALQMPSAAWILMNNVMAESATESTKNMYSLPPLDSVLRPCIDPKITKLTVTQLEIEKVEVVPKSLEDSSVLAAVQSGHSEQQPKVKVLQSKATNRVIQRHLIASKESLPAERIRGGGGPECDNIIESADEPKLSADPEPAIVAAEQEGSLSQQNVHTSVPFADCETNYSSTMDNTPSPLLALPTSAHVAQPVQVGHPLVSFREATTNQSSNHSFTSNVDFRRSDDPDNSVPMEAVLTPDTPLEVTGNAVQTGHTQETGISNQLASFTQNEKEVTVTPSLLEREQAMPSAALTSAAPSIALTDSAWSLIPGGATITTPPVASASTSPAPGQPEIKESETAPPPLGADATVQLLNPAESARLVETCAPVHVAQSVSLSTTLPVAQSPAPSSSVADAPVSNEHAMGTEQTMTIDVKSTANPVLPAQNAAISALTEIQVKNEDGKTDETKTKDKREVPPSQSLTFKPAPEWEQFKPGANDETVTPPDQLPPRPEWYKKDSISDMERFMLPEWFDSSARHRTPDSFLTTRETVVQISDVIENRNVTNAMIRRAVAGDAGSLHRLRCFLVHWGIINEDAINDSSPTPSSLRLDLKRPNDFSEGMREDLISAVVQQAKRHKLSHDADVDHEMGVEPSVGAAAFVPIDWYEVAHKVGHGTSAEECEQFFLIDSFEKEESASPTAERPITPDATQQTTEPAPDERVATALVPLSLQTKKEMEHEVIKKLVARSDPRVLKELLNTAMKMAGGKLQNSTAETLLGLQLTRSVEEARGHELDLAVRMSKLIDMRMQKLENRMGMMDDVEGILEAEKVALELERRDLYTSRCRHWFGGL